MVKELFVFNASHIDRDYFKFTGFFEKNSQPVLKQLTFGIKDKQFYAVASRQIPGDKSSLVKYHIPIPGDWEKYNEYKKFHGFWKSFFKNKK
jgi:hypothetical protein